MTVEPEIVLGPPGTGKTTTLIGYVEQELAAGTPPDRIAYITFTRKAAEEAQTRMMAKFKLSKRDLPYFRTIHSLAMQWVGVQSSQVLDKDKLKQFADWIGEKITGSISLEAGTLFGHERGDRMMFMDNLARLRMVPLQQVYNEYHDELDWALVERFSRGLQSYKVHHSLVDYTDMLQMFINNGTAPRLSVLFVDEAQDLSRLQWAVAWALARTAQRVVVAGDDDQAIYRWAGADVETLINLQGKVRVLGQSWRVPQAVQQLSNNIIARVKHRRPKTWAPRQEQGVLEFINNLGQVEWDDESILVLTRNRYQLLPIAAELRASGYFYSWEGRGSVGRATLAGIIAWERLRRGEPVPVGDVLRAYALLATGSGVKRGFKQLPGFDPQATTTLAELTTNGGLLRTDPWFHALEKLDDDERRYILRCRRHGELLTKPPRITLSTIHGSKGGEAHKVVLCTDMAPRTYAESSTQPEDEARVWYVGATRAKQHLTVLRPATQFAYRL